jgi:hypothetical protein
MDDSYSLHRTPDRLVNALRIAFVLTEKELEVLEHEN